MTLIGCLAGNCQGDAASAARVRLALMAAPPAASAAEATNRSRRDILIDDLWEPSRSKSWNEPRFRRATACGCTCRKKYERRSTARGARARSIHGHPPSGYSLNHLALSPPPGADRRRRRRYDQHPEAAK